MGANQRIENTTVLSVDILAVGERIAWTGAGTLTLTDASGATLGAPLASGGTFTTTAVGTVSARMSSDQTGAWSIVVSNAAGTVFPGRLHSTSWTFFTGSFAQSAATDASFYALVPGGTPGRTGVVELRLDGLSGNFYELFANATGVDGPNAGRSVTGASPIVLDRFDLYVNPPEIADFDFTTPVLASGAFDAGTAPAACASIVPGVNTGTFEFSSNVEGNYNLVCDLNDDGVFDAVGGDDFFQIGTTTIGANTVVWDGFDADGDAVAAGDYDCRLVITVGEFHYLGTDMETSYEGMRMFRVDSGGARVGLPMFWNDTLVQSSAVTLPAPTSVVGLETSGPNGIDSGDTSASAIPNVNARAWGNFSSAGKGNNNTLDTFTRVEVSNAFNQTITILGATADGDGDGLTNYEEECVIGTSPTDDDTDGDGIPDDVESTPSGGGPAAAIDSDGDGTPDALDLDSDDDGIPDLTEGHDADFDGVPDVAPSGADADLDGLDDAFDPMCTPACAANGTAAPTPDRDMDGIPDYRDADDDGDGIPTSVECPSLACADTDGDGTPDSLDLDSDGDGIPDAIEAHDVDGDGVADVAPSGSDLDGDGLDDAYDAMCEPACAMNGTAAPLPDADGDLTPDVLDVDDDGDGVGTLTEGTRDTDGDGTPDYLDQDDDGDGIGTRNELGAMELGDGDLDDADAMDSDGDGTPDYLDQDDDDDGIATLTELGETERDDGDLDTADALDTDGNGVPDYLDTDDDGDGLATATECPDETACGDTDGNGTPDYLDLDDDGDGVATEIECPGGVCRDTDGNGTPDYLDDDDDGDGVSTAVELGATEREDDDLDVADARDTDGDGTLDFLDTDDDGDGIGTAVECTDSALGCENTDAALGDDVPDYLDADDDGDGIDTIVEIGDVERMDGDEDAADAVDTDGNGRPDYLDGDDDGDGVATRFEIGDVEAMDGDGDANEALDTDMNGTPDYLDTDDDGDGVPTAEELGPDENGDGNPSDAQNTDMASGDMIADYLDPDDDGDTIPTATEVSDGAMLPDGADDDVDGDGIPNRLDEDSDDDGILDSAEAGLDLDMDGVPDYLDADSSPRDTDGDGRRDDVECDFETRTTMPDDCPDTDDDGTPDYLDDDDDGDGVPTQVETGAGDTDMDGTPDFLDPDDDGDGLPTADEDRDGDGDPTGDDLDGDGLPDYLDPDDDGDGIPTATERADEDGADTDGDGVPAEEDLDSDGDGLGDAAECPTGADCPDEDGDSIPGYLDPDEFVGDADGDGVPDEVECPTPGDCPDTDGDGITDELDDDDDGDGIPTRDEAPMGVDRDTDGDGVPDRLDDDDDGDGIPTLEEAPGGVPMDSDGDGVPDNLDDDDDDDGIPTLVEREDGLGPDGMSGPGLDADGDGTPNHLDTDSDDDGILDADEGREDEDMDGLPNYLDAPDVGGVAGGALCSAGPNNAPSFAFLMMLLALVLRRRRRSGVAGAAVAGLLAAGMLLTGAQAEAQPAFTLERFRPAPLVNDGFQLGSARDLGHKNWQAQLYLDYTNDPLVFESIIADRDSETASVVEHQLVMTPTFAYGLWDRLVIYGALPINLVQNGDDAIPNTVAQADGAGIGDIVAGARVRIWSNDAFSLAGQLTLTLPLASWANGDQAYTGDRTVTGHPEVLAHVDLGPLELRANVGVKLRRASQLVGVEADHDLTYGLGVAIPVWDDQIHILAELFGNSALSNAFGREESPLEILGGMKYFHESGFTAGVGVGAGLLRGVGAPDIRVLGMLGYAPGGDTDEDGDGLLGRDDACPEVAEDFDEFEDTDGCPDLDDDEDGILDTDDACRLQPEDRDEFEDTDGCPDPDNDGDGIADTADECPMEPEDRDEFEDANGCPDPDNDEDGVLDTDDECPLVPGLVSAAGCPAPDRDGDGVPDALDNCPDEPGTEEFRGCDAPQQVVIEGDRLDILDKVYFATSRSVIQRRSYALLDNVAQVLNAHPEIENIRVEGHTDARGRRAANLRLSQNRANAVVRYLVRKGVDRQRLAAVGFGPDRPLVADASTDEELAQNRRVEFVIVHDGDTGIVTR